LKTTLTLTTAHDSDLIPRLGSFRRVAGTEAPQPSVHHSGTVTAASTQERNAASSMITNNQRVAQDSRRDSNQLVNHPTNNVPVNRIDSREVNRVGSKDEGANYQLNHGSNEGSRSSLSVQASGPSVVYSHSQLGSTSYDTLVQLAVRAAIDEEERDYARRLEEFREMHRQREAEMERERERRLQMVEEVRTAYALHRQSGGFLFVYWTPSSVPVA